MCPTWERNLVMLSVSQSDLICKSLAVCDSKRGPEIGEGQALYLPAIPFRWFLPPSWHLPYTNSEKLEQGQQWAMPAEAKRAPVSSGFSIPNADSGGSSEPPPAAGHGPSTQIRALGCEGTFGAAWDAGVRWMTVDGEISLYR